MTIVVDTPRWSWRGERWAHLASDTELGELHRFANDVGLRRLAFQGDHYDVPESRWEQAVAHGAHVVDSRDLVRRLRTAGLRRRRPMGWERHLGWHRDDPRRLDASLASVALPTAIGSDIIALTDVHAAIVLCRPDEWGVGVTVGAESDLGVLEPEPTRWVAADGTTRHIDWFVVRRPAQHPPDSYTPDP